MDVTKIKGFLKKAQTVAGKRIYTGRFTFQSVQWAGEGDEALATFTITAGELCDMAESNLLWTDQDVQRGMRPEVTPKPQRELSVGAGFPDPKAYIFDADKADDITEKLLRGERLFLSPLIWNLRPDAFQAYFDKSKSSVYFYSGRLYLPDSHHRQQAIVKAVREFRDSPTAYPRFSEQMEFMVELYFLSRENEGNYFFDKNQRPKPTANSKAFDLTTADDLSMLAKRVIDKSKALTGNVNRVTDRLTAKNPQVMTLSTLREMMKDLTVHDSLDSTELEGLAQVAASFYDLLAEIRPELGVIDVANRKLFRERSVSEAAVMMHGYASLMSEYNSSLTDLGARAARVEWKGKLERLGSNIQYRFGTWRGDFFDKANPLWQKVGVVKPSRKSQRLTVINTGGARSECGRVLRQLVASESKVRDLGFLAS
jgi:hypothetical protein